ncbi:7583_t:CDS:1, partial [Cetraspora pellucida]
MTKEAKLTIGYDGLDLPCQGCYELDPQVTNYQAIHLIISEKDKRGVYSTPCFYCASCSRSVLENMKLQAFNVGSSLEDNRNIYKLTNEELK